MKTETTTDSYYASDSKKTTVNKDESSVLNVPTRTTTLTGAIFNLTKSAVGAGTVYFPSTFVSVGLATAIPLLLSSAMFCAIPLYFLGRLAHHCETGDYFKLGRLAMGKAGENGVSIALLLFLVGGLIAYANLTGLCVSTAIETLSGAKNSYLTPGNLTLLFAAFAIFPLSCMRDMGMLAKTSIFGMMCMLYIAGLLAYDALTFGNETFGISSTLEYAVAAESTWSGYAYTLMKSIGTLIFAFVNHFTIVSLVPVMKNPSAKSRMTLVSASTGIAVVIYLLAGLGGYSRFGANAIGKNALMPFINMKDASLSFPVPLPYTIAQIALGIVLVCSYPLLCDPARACLDSLVFGPSSSVNATFRHYLETSLIVAIPSAVAYFTQDKADGFLSLFSGLCGSLLVFVFPALFFLILSRPFKYSVGKIESTLAYFCIGLGTVLAILSTTVNIMEFVKTESA